MLGRQVLQTLECECNGSVATVTLRRPEALNALNAAMMDELEAVFSQLEIDEEVRAVLLTGSGARAFAAGADIRELLQTDAASGGKVSERGQQVFSSIENCSKPVIACINGIAFGGGLELALACTFRLASDTSRLGLPELRLGLIPGFGGIQRLTRLVGRGNAFRLILTAQPISAGEALRLGVVEEVLPTANLLIRGRALAESIAVMAPLSVMGLLEAVRGGESSDLEEAYRAESKVFARLCGTSDKEEGLAAFLEKRAPVWTGH